MQKRWSVDDDTDGRKRCRLVVGWRVRMEAGKPPQNAGNDDRSTFIGENRQISGKSGPEEAGREAGIGKPSPGIFPSGF